MADQVLLLLTKRGATRWICPKVSRTQTQALQGQDRLMREVESADRAIDNLVYELSLEGLIYG